ncbi:hypothetical protein EV2_029019 [Malus domestica]
MQAENPGFFYAIQLDDENRMTNVFWVDARSRTAYNHFGDAVIFDTMYRPNHYQVPFTPFTGVNHHGQKAPVSITTDQDRAIQVAAAQYERALEHSLEKKIESDYDTMCTAPVLKTPSPMEQQAANLYTNKVFAKFQEELVETFVYTANKIEGDGIVSNYRVAKYEHDDKAYIVILNVTEIKASCSYQMFEYSGILCRPILTVFTVTNVLTLPSHYILKRWTRNAKSCVGLEEEEGLDLQGIETLTMRFNNLCQEAIKYAEEGAVAVETYNAAMSALREGGKKIAVVKKNVAKVTPPSS